MFAQDDLYPLSALQHYAFCPRQCALIHVEQQWAENRLTAEGRLLHDRVHERETEARGGVLTSRGLRIRSLELGLAGQADVVEFHPVRGTGGAVLPGRKGRWCPVPVEYKRGKPKRTNCDAVQLCAQAICLEEMLGVGVPVGFLFYGRNRRRKEIVFDDTLRGETRGMAAAVHGLLARRRTPPAEVDSRCGQCSLRSICLPAAGRGRGYVARRIGACLSDREGER
jgi:CRISPR-associated exonuclease Cas4